jgi:hypothetical protein
MRLASVLALSLGLAPGCHHFTAAPASGAVELGQAEDFAKGQQSPTGIVVDSSSVYWIDQGGTGQPGALLKLDRGSHDAPGVLSSAVGTPAGLTQDATRLFVGSNIVAGNGSFQLLYRVPKQGLSGAAPEGVQVAFSSQLFGVTFSGGEVVFALEQNAPSQFAGKVGAVPADTWASSQEHDFASDTGQQGFSTVTAVAADVTAVYAAVTGFILKLGKDKSLPIRFAPTTGTARALVLDSGVLFWADGDKVRSLSVDKPGDEPTKIAEGQNDPAGIAIHGDEIFWTEQDGGNVWRASKKDGSGKAAIANGEPGPSSIAVDDSGAVYWTTQDGRVRVARPK